MTELSDAKTLVGFQRRPLTFEGDQSARADWKKPKSGKAPPVRAEPE